MSTGARGWLAIAAFVAVWDAVCRRDQMLTDTARRHPVVTFLAVTLVGGHLTRALPQCLDPLHAAVTLIRRDRGRTTRNHVSSAVCGSGRHIAGFSIGRVDATRR